jgi:hypothetical protein
MYQSIYVFINESIYQSNIYKGYIFCRCFLDGIDDSESLINRVIEGRCTICRGSTYEEECEDDEDILLCDGMYLTLYLFLYVSI